MAQLNLEFRSIDIESRNRPLSLLEVANRLSISVQQVLDLVTDGQFTALDISSPGAKRKSYRIPVESYRDFVVRRLTGPRRAELLRQLPRPVLEELHRDLARILAA